MNTKSILQELIKIPSYVDLKRNEKEITNFIEKIFIATNYIVEKQKVEKNRVNLIVHDNESPKVILFGHMDTVIPQRVAKLDSFKPKIIGNKMYGLGSVDMKAGLAIMISQALKNKKKGLALIFTCDEEYEFKGARKLIEEYRYKPKLIINLEPTNLKILNGCRGITDFSFKVFGKSCHASQKHLGINAIEKSVELVNLLGEKLGKFDYKNGNKTTINLSYLHGGTLNQFEKNQSSISGLGMVVPNYAEVNCEIRIGNPRITKSFVQSEIESLVKTLGIIVKDINFKFYLKPMYIHNSKLNNFEFSLKEKNVPIEYLDINKSGFYEVQLLQKKFDSSCVIFGPGPMELAHTANEYVNLDSMNRTESVIECFLKNTL